MRTSAILLMGVLFTVNLLVAAPGHGQGKMDKTISIDYRHASFLTVLKAIEKAADVVIMYELTPAIENEKVDFTIKNKPVAEALNLLIKGKNLKWTFKESENILRLEDASETTATPAEHLSTPLLPPPPITVRGRIVNENGEPVIASVIIKGTTRGTTSDANGEFELNNAQENDVLVISSIGFITKEVSVSQLSNAGMVKLLRSDSKLDEVQIIAYGSTSYRSNITSVSTIKAKDIQDQPVLNPLQSLQGRVPGVYVSNTTGVSGGAINISIRGRNSLRNSLLDNGNEVLYIVDGITYPSRTVYSRLSSDMNTGYGNILSTIDPNDIESIDVLKDAGATAVYGSQGANGVVIITTKKAKSGNTKMDLNVSQGIGQIPKRLKLLNTIEYLQLRREALTNDGLVPQVDDVSQPGYAPDVLIWDQMKSTDWIKQLMGGTANRTSVQGSVSMGTNNLRFLASGNYVRQGNVFGTDDSYSRGTGRFTLNYLSKNSKFSFDYTTSYGFEKNQIPYDLTMDALFLPPNFPELKDSAGNLTSNQEAYNLSIYNPLRNQYIINTTKNGDFTGNLQFAVELVKSLKFRTILSYLNKEVSRSVTYPMKSYAPQDGGVRFTTWEDGKNINWSIDPQMVFNKHFDFGSIDFLAGTSFQQNTGESVLRTSAGFLDDNSLLNPAAASYNGVDAYDKVVYRYNRAFSRIMYNYLDKYLFDASVSRDGSTRFGSGRKFGTFYSLAGGWVFSNEMFLRRFLPLTSFGKLRVSYGTTGNDKIPDYQYLNSLGYQSSYADIISMLPLRIANQSYGWETTRKLDIGLDLGFYKDRILFSLNWYENRSSNQLVGLPLTQSSGFSSIQYNLDAVLENTGLESSLNTVNVKRSKFEWASNINISLPNNKLLKYPGLEQSSNRNIYQVGKSTYVAKQLLSNAVDPATGSYIFADLDHDGAITSLDRDFYKKRTQTIFAGLGNSIKYKNIQIDFLFQFVKQMGFDYRYYFRLPGFPSNQPIQVLNRWQKPGDFASVQKFSQSFNSYNDYYNFSSLSTGNVTDASFIKLRNIAIAYFLPTDFCKKVHLTQGKIYLQGQNLLTLTRYVGLDPETGSNNLPPLKMIAAGIQLSF